MNEVESVILTGASGFIGKHCIEHLLEAGYVVHALYHTEERQSPLPQRDRLRWHRVNILDQQQVASVIRPLRATQMLHLAWYTEPGKFWDSRLNWDWLRASVHLLKTFTEAGGKRFVGAGSCAEYDWKKGKLSETTPLNAATLYGQCKSSLFQTAQQNATMSGVEFAWGRIFWIYGPGEDKRRVIPYVINALLNDEVAMCSEGSQQRDFLYVNDVARAFTELLASKIQGAVNIGSGEAVSIKDLTSTLGRLIDKEDLIQLGEVNNEMDETPLVVADITRLKDELKFTPEYNLEDGLRLSMEWWRKGRQRPPLARQTGSFRLPTPPAQE